MKQWKKALKNAGVNIQIKRDDVTIIGENNQKGGNYVVTNHDHRIAMSMLVFGMVSDEPIVIDEISMIDTSFPNLGVFLKYWS